MSNARVSLNIEKTIAPVKRLLFGSFVEHMGRCVYGGVYEPGHPSADSDGFREDVASLTKEMGVTVVRYPGGNFVSGLIWEDSVGPAELRPTRLDLAWRSIETNQFGLNEFMKWVDLVGAEPMMALNLGTRGVQEAAHLVEYCNHAGSSALSDLRREHGVEDPHQIKLWCLGNELDGWWQIGHKTAEEYGRLAAETAKAVRLVDPSVTLVAVGSSNERMPTYGSWERTVLDHTFDYVELISLHAYYEKHGDDSASFMAESARMNRYIKGVVAAADEIAEKKGSDKRINLSFDEWNVWYQQRFVKEDLNWAVGPRIIEDEYTEEDAVVVGGLLMTLLNNADRVDVACQAQLVNVIGPIRAEPDIPAWRQTIFHPFALTARHAKGNVLSAEVECGTYDTENISSVPFVDVAATHDADSGEILVLILNRDTANTTEVSLEFSGLSDLDFLEAFQLGGGDLSATNTADHPDRVLPRPITVELESGAKATLSVPAISWSIVRLRAK